MNYQETIQYIYNRMPLFQVVGSSAYKPGLDSMKSFDEYLGHPHQSFATIHVAGTNGKGSVSHTLASVLQSAGYKVGLFTSPHLRDFRERVRVNGEMMSQQFVIDFVKKYQNVFDVLYPSFFEVNVAMAFDYFRQQQIDVAVVEVGLGGRLDSTNIITPKLSIITNISLDHTAILGDTVELIAGEKAGIIKPGVPVVIGEADQPGVRQVFINKAHQEGAPIFFVDEQIKTEGVTQQIGTDRMPYQHFVLNGFALNTPLLGLYQQKNIPTAYLAVLQLRRLGFHLTDEAVSDGFSRTLSQTHLLGRWQKIGDSPLTICDTGHNEAGITYIVQQLRQTPHRTLRIVYGVMKDKDIAHILPLLPREAVYYFTRAAISRSLPQDELKKRAEAVGLKGNAYPSIAEALAAARGDSAPEDLLFVGGSTYVVAEIL
jgi:dihydrofolate synthase/folylpolyglutamate synthase